MAGDADWFDAWVVAHVKRLGLRAGKAAADATHYLLDRRAVLVGQRGATPARLAQATERCLADTPTPRFNEGRFDALCRHLKDVVADEIKAAELARAGAAAGGLATADPETIRRLEEMGLRNWAKRLKGEAGGSDAPAPAAGPRLHTPPPAGGGDGQDTSFDPAEFEREGEE